MVRREWIRNGRWGLRYTGKWRIENSDVDQNMRNTEVGIQGPSHREEREDPKKLICKER